MKFLDYIIEHILAGGHKHPPPEGPKQSTRKEFAAKTKYEAKCRAGWQCQMTGCGEKNNLEVHHKNGNHDNSLENAIVYCSKHHRMYHEFLNQMRSKR